jgi:hypothetical protein
VPLRPSPNATPSTAGVVETVPSWLLSVAVTTAPEQTAGMLLNPSVLVVAPTTDMPAQGPAP